MVTHKAVNSMIAENRIRSAKAPTISAGVMQAKVIWKAIKIYSGIITPSVKVSASLADVTPARNNLPVPPQKALSEPPKAKE